MQSDAQDEFFRTHDLVWVRLHEPRLLELAPMSHGKRGGFAGDPAAAISVRLPIRPAEFWNAVLLAFEKCS